MKISSKDNVQKLRAVGDKDPKDTLNRTLGNPISDKDLKRVCGGGFFKH